MADRRRGRAERTGRGRGAGVGWWLALVVGLAPLRPVSPETPREVVSGGRRSVFVDKASQARGAFAPLSEQVLVVYTMATGDGSEVRAQRLDVHSGRSVGSESPVSGPPESDIEAHSAPALAMDPVRDECLVVWVRNLNVTSPSLEILGRRLDAASGEPIGAAFPVSPRASWAQGVSSSAPAVVFSAAQAQYLVVFEHDAPGSAAVASGIIGQRVASGSGDLVGGPFTVAGYPDDHEGWSRPDDPELAYDVVHDQVLVVWQQSRSSVHDPEIWGQRVAASTGALLGEGGFRVSFMGPDGEQGFGAAHPRVVHSSGATGYLVVWEGVQAEELAPGSVPPYASVPAIFGQRVDPVTGLVDGEALRISPVGSASPFDPKDPGVGVDPVAGEVLIVWQGPWRLVQGQSGYRYEMEVFGRRLDALSFAAIDRTVLRISRAGPPDDPSVVPQRPEVICAPTFGTSLVLWAGDGTHPSTGELTRGVFGEWVPAAGQDPCAQGEGPCRRAPREDRLPATGWVGGTLRPTPARAGSFAAGG